MAHQASDSSTALHNVNIANYTLIEQLYVGSRTVVYRAIQDADQRPVVVKILQRELLSVTEVMQFRNQYTLTKGLNISGIICPIGLEPWRNGYALVMEDIGGVSLADYGQSKGSKTRTPLPLVDVLAIAIQLSTTLHELGQHRIIHKDIKPANILIQPDSKQVKLIDFSIASLLPRETQEIQNPNVLEGTLAYLAPEQTGRMNRGIDYRADFYGLGVTLYELLTGELPFQSSDPLELLHCHIAKPPTPLTQLQPSLPAMVSAIVLKLMAKNAEDRYQSALGLKHDLEHCLTQWKQTSTIAEFELGQYDIGDRFLLPEKLYGRDKDVQTLLAAFERVAKGGSEIMLVAGFSGIGKTAVINEVHKPITRQQGYFIRGKFDQFNRNIPLSAFIQALRHLMGQLLSESDAQLAQWRTKLLAAVGDSGQVLIDVIPELAQVIGSQPPVPKLSGTATQNRFNLLFQKFIAVFTKAEHPLVMFLDDLQWADATSIQLIKLLMQDGGHLLLLGAYRDNEVTPTHLLMLMLDDLKTAGTVVNTVTLESLSAADNNQLVADTLQCTTLQSQSLATLVHQKTKGNPFFTTQFLKALHESGHISFNYEQGYWICQVDQIDGLTLPEDVVDFMAQRLQKLPAETQQILKLAACIGNQFDLTTLAIVAERSPRQTATALWSALQEGLILTKQQTYKLFQPGEAIQIDSDSLINLTYRFLHDRVQQAAYCLIPATQKQITHLTIGCLLLEKTESTEREEKLFDIVNHLNFGQSLIAQAVQRAELVELNLAAGRKAKAANAYSAAIIYFTTGIELLEPDCWQSQYELTLALHEAIAEAMYLTGKFDPLNNIISQILKFAKTLLDKITTYEIKIQADLAQNHLSEAIETALNVLGQLNIQLPKTPNQAQILLGLTKTKLILLGKKQQDLVNLPAMTHPEKLAAMRIMASALSAAFIGSPKLFPLLVFQQVNLSVQHGNMPLSAFAYAWYAILLCGVVRDINAGYEFGQLALQILERFQAEELRCKTTFVVNCFIQFWKQHLNVAMAGLQQAYESGIETGDVEYAAWSVAARGMQCYWYGNELSDLKETLQHYSDAISQSKLNNAQVYLNIFHESVSNLMGHAAQPNVLNGSYYSEIHDVQRQVVAGDRNGLFYSYINQLHLRYLFNDISGAIEAANQAKQYEDAGTALFSNVPLNFYGSLTRLAAHAAASQSERLRLLRQVAKNQKRLQKWANSAPMNSRHKWDLVEAERYRILGKKTQAIAAYDRAISGARENNYLQEEALGNELAAKFYLDWDKATVAAGYMKDAYICYAKWGAKAKTSDLETHYPNLLDSHCQALEKPLDSLATLVKFALPSSSSISRHTSTRHSPSSSTSINTALDFAAVLKASQALSGNIHLDELLRQLTQIILQNSGGDRCGLVLLNQADEWRVAAIATSEETKLSSAPLDGYPDLPVQLIQYVKNTQAVVVVDDLNTDLPVIGRYLNHHRPKSVLCLPIVNQGHAVGILYLSNQATTGVFTEDRLLILNFLCTQAAISLENARLYLQVQQQVQSIAQKEEQYRSMFENAGDGLSIIELETGRVLAVNPSCCEMFGYTESEFKSLSAPDFVHADELPNFASNMALIKAGQKFATEARSIHKQGHIFDVGVAAAPINYNGKIHALSVLRDITERKQAEMALKQSEAQLRIQAQSIEQAMQNLQKAQMQIVQSEKMSALGNLVAGVAHEINNPVGFLKGNISPAQDYVSDLLGLIDLFLAKTPQLDDDIEAEIEAIDLAFIRQDLPDLLASMTLGVNRIKNISTSLRTFSRADQNHKTAFNLHEGINSTLLILKHRLKADDQRPAIEIVKDYGNLPKIACFPGQLNQVFMNILANAVDALEESNQGKAYAEITAAPNQINVTTQVSADEEHVIITIQDNGIGMPETVKRHIFEHLYTTKGVGKGTGLGLAISRQIIVETHGGNLDVQSEPGQGTTFSIQLPITA